MYKIASEMRLVIVESPYAGKTPINTRANIKYARACIADCLKRGEAPFASHLLYTPEGVLDDTKPEQRYQGIQAGFAWARVSAARIFYTDRGMSSGMRAGLSNAKYWGQTIEYRTLGNDWKVSDV